MYLCLLFLLVTHLNSFSFTQFASFATKAVKNWRYTAAILSTAVLVAQRPQSGVAPDGACVRRGLLWPTRGSWSRLTWNTSTNHRLLSSATVFIIRFRLLQWSFCRYLFLCGQYQYWNAKTQSDSICNWSLVLLVVL